MQIIQEFDNKNWQDKFPFSTQSNAIEAIENGKLLQFSQLPFLLSPQEQQLFMLDYSKLKSKNISYHPTTKLLHGVRFAHEQHENIKNMMQRFASYATTLVTQLFEAYAPFLKTGRTSFRPVEVSNRASSYRKDDTRLHVDAFPATPNHGQRILRVFTNINPHGQERLWRIGESFGKVAARFLPTIRKPLKGKATIMKALKITKQYRTEYDHIMLQLHNRMKADMDYQVKAEQTEVGFMPGTSWIVQTDHVSHAAMSGRYMLEQTFYLPVHAMQNPHLSPLRILEQMTGRVLV